MADGWFCKNKKNKRLKSNLNKVNNNNKKKKTKRAESRKINAAITI